MYTTSDKDLKTMRKALKFDSSNVDLMNLIAIGYLERNDEKSFKIANEYFKNAYKIKKTIKSTHNYAWFLHFEGFEENDRELAIEIQKECIELSPNSFLPYLQYGYMLIIDEKFEEAIPYLEKAQQKEKRRDIVHNLGYCYLRVERFNDAQSFFTLALDGDVGNVSLFHLALTEWKLNNFFKVKLIADKLSKNIKPNWDNDIHGLQIGILYFLLEDYQGATKCMIKQKYGMDFIESPELSYSLYMVDKNKWKKRINIEIQERSKRIHKIINKHKDWKDYNNKEIKEWLEEFKVEINERLELLINGMSKPSLNLSENIYEQDVRCLLFECNLCDNLPAE